MHIETIAVHAGHAPDPASGALTPPITLSTTFEREGDGTYRAGYIYSRNATPNRTALEECLAALEGGDAALAFASGSAASMSILQTLSPGDHVIAPADAYYGTLKLVREIFGPWGIDATFVEMSNPKEVEHAFKARTRLVWVETPSNPLVSTADIALIAQMSRAAGAVCVVDNTWATPIGQRPLDLGAHVSMHSTTKYLGGHSDVLGGALILRGEPELTAKLRLIQSGGGAVQAPFDSWLLLRGIRTLPYRMRAHTENAMRVAEYLSSHARVERVHYPGLKSDPGHEIASRQMQLFGGMLSFVVKGGTEAAMAAAAKMQVITRATSLGGTESLIEHRASVEGAATRAPGGLLRFSVGLEHVDDLIEDLDQALS